MTLGLIVATLLARAEAPPPPQSGPPAAGIVPPAAPGMPAGSSPETATDSPFRAALVVYVDDRVAERLEGATVGVRQAGSRSAPLRDDGVAPDGAAGDRVYAARLDVALAERVGLHVDDTRGAVGELSVFLPSAREAEVRLRTLGDPPGLALAQEATAIGGSATGGGAVTPGGAGDGRDRLAHVLWVMIALFAIGFTYVRAVVSRRWEGEVEPVLRRLERYLDAQESGRDDERR